MNQINDNLVGQTLDARFRVLAPIAAGKDGALYKALDTELQYEVALRFVAQTNIPEKPLANLRANAESARTLVHPNIVRMYSFNIPADGRPYFVVDCVQSTDNLQKVLEQYRTVVEEVAISLCIQICDALEHAHGKGIAHRNLKPSNMMLIAAGGGAYMVKVADFGVGTSNELAGSRSNHNHTSTNVPYMSPEACAGKPATTSSDIYAVGCILFHSLTGQAPFEGANPFEVMNKHLTEPHPDLISLAPNLKHGTQLRAIINRALAKDPARRYQSIRDMSADLTLLNEVSADEWNARASAMKPVAASATKSSAAETSATKHVSLFDPKTIMLGACLLAALVVLPAVAVVGACLFDVELPGLSKFKLSILERVLPPSDPKWRQMMETYKAKGDYADAWTCREHILRAGGSVGKTE